MILLSQVYQMNFFFWKQMWKHKHLFPTIYTPKVAECCCQTDYLYTCCWLSFSMLQQIHGLNVVLMRRFIWIGCKPPKPWIVVNNDGSRCVGRSVHPCAISVVFHIRRFIFTSSLVFNHGLHKNTQSKFVFCCFNFKNAVILGRKCTIPLPIPIGQQFPCKWISFPYSHPSHTCRSCSQKRNLDSSFPHIFCGKVVYHYHRITTFDALQTLLVYYFCDS